MALYNSKPVVLILISLLMLHRNSQTSFNFANFSGPYRNEIITYQGDAYESNGVIELTHVQNGSTVNFSAGRVSYALPVRLWDSKTNQSASFTSTFSFRISMMEPINGDGISFFIAPFDSEIPQNSDGGYLGLFDPNSAFTASKNQIIAVEFDTYPNNWDPNYAHVGIDVNSIDSVTTKQWKNDDPTDGITTVFATVSYEAVAKNLSVVVTYPGSDANEPAVSLAHVIDLKTVLPELVSVGFSGSTGARSQIHHILSWSFSSSFD